MHPTAPSHLFRTALLLWVAVFFCLVVPLHHRGLVSLPGAVSSSDSSKPYCPLCTLWDSNDGPPPADAPIGCAICHLKSNLELPPSWTPPPTMVATLEFSLPPADHVRSPRVRRQVRLGGRAPPAA